MSKRVTLRTASVALLVLCELFAATAAQAQTYRRRHERERGPKQVEHAAPPVSVDKRDTIVAAPSPFAGRPYWLALAQCGGIYFKLNTLYSDIAVHARVVKPDPTANTEYTRKLNEAIKTATAFFTGAEHFLMTNRKIERVDAVLIYDDQSRAAGDRVSTVDAALNAAKTCPALYHTCQHSYPKACSEPLTPLS